MSTLAISNQKIKCTYLKIQSNPILYTINKFKDGCVLAAGRKNGKQTKIGSIQCVCHEFHWSFTCAFLCHFVYFCLGRYWDTSPSFINFV